MPTLLPRAIRQKFLINGCLLVVLALITGVIAAWYVSNEHYFYSWDFVAYQNWAVDLAFAFRDSKRTDYKSSLVLNEDIVRSAGWELYGRKGSILNILGTAHVKRRDFYPLERLL